MAGQGVAMPGKARRGEARRGMEHLILIKQKEDW